MFSLPADIIIAPAVLQSFPHHYPFCLKYCPNSVKTIITGKLPEPNDDTSGSGSFPVIMVLLSYGFCLHITPRL